MFLFLRIVKVEKAPALDFALLGAMIGLGLLSKYAMIYFPAAIIFAALLDRPAASKNNASADGHGREPSQYC